jgi:hypothetical protein
MPECSICYEENNQFPQGNICSCAENYVCINCLKQLTSDIENKFLFFANNNGYDNENVLPATAWDYACSSHGMQIRYKCPFCKEDITNYVQSLKLNPETINTLHHRLCPPPFNPIHNLVPQNHGHNQTDNIIASQHVNYSIPVNYLLIFGEHIPCVNFIRLLFGRNSIGYNSQRFNISLGQYQNSNWFYRPYPPHLPLNLFKLIIVVSRNQYEAEVAFLRLIDLHEDTDIIILTPAGQAFTHTTFPNIETPNNRNYEVLHTFIQSIVRHLPGLNNLMLTVRYAYNLYSQNFLPRNDGEPFGFFHHHGRDGLLKAERLCYLIEGSTSFVSAKRHLRSFFDNSIQSSDYRRYGGSINANPSSYISFFLNELRNYPDLAPKLNVQLDDNMDYRQDGREQKRARQAAIRALKSMAIDIWD